MFLSPKTFKTFHKIVENMSFVKKVVVFGNEISEPKILQFENLTSAKVDIKSFKTNNFDGKFLPCYFRYILVVIDNYVFILHGF